MSNLLAALGRGPAARTRPTHGAPARHQRARTATALGALPGISFMPRADYGEPNDWLTCILVDPDAYGATPEDIRVALEAQDIEARPTWKPLHLQPLFADTPVVGGDVAAGSSSVACACRAARPSPTPTSARVVEVIEHLSVARVGSRGAPTGGRPRRARLASQKAESRGRDRRPASRGDFAGVVVEPRRAGPGVDRRRRGGGARAGAAARESRSGPSTSCRASA